MSVNVNRICLIEQTAQGISVRKLYQTKDKSARKVSKFLRPKERSERRVLEAMNLYTSELLARHNRSNEKRRDGFLRDREVNVMRAKRKAWKRLTR